MNLRGLGRSKKLRRAFLAGVLLLAVAFAREGPGASEKYGMPSEDEARRYGYTGSGRTGEQLARVRSLATQEDRLFVNGEPFVLKRQTRFEDERGARIRLEEIPAGAQIAIEYRTGSNLEDSGYGPEAKILTRVRIVAPPPQQKPAP